MGAGVSLSLPALAQMQDATPEATPEGDMSTHVQLSGSIRQIHDPVLIKSPDGYHVYFTGNGIGTKKSADMHEWERDFPVSVFSKAPQWVADAIPGVTNLWAPDISYFNDKYHLYYAGSTFGSNRSVIGLATNVTLDSTADEFKWVDEGLVIESHRTDPYNCIDPNLVIDAEGTPWLSFRQLLDGHQAGAARLRDRQARRGRADDPRARLSPADRRTQSKRRSSSAKATSTICSCRSTLLSRRKEHLSRDGRALGEHHRTLR